MKAGEAALRGNVLFYRGTSDLRPSPPSMTREGRISGYGLAAFRRACVRLYRPLVAALLVPLFLAGGQSVRPPDQANRTNPEVDAALSAPPELGADLLITIAQGSHLSKKNRIEILVRAFDLAGSAKYALRRTPATAAAYNTDSDAGTISAALRPGLDRLSLQSRVIKELALLEPALARRLFDTSRHISIPSLTCEDALGYSLDEFYQSALAVISHTYSAKEAADGEPATLAEDLLRHAASPFQLNGALQLLLHDKWSTDELQTLASVFAATLAQLSADDRSFTAGTNFSALQSLIRFVARLRTNNINPYPVIRAFREYLVRHLRASRCADTAESEEISRLVDLFTQDLVSKFTDLSPITAEDRKPNRLIQATARVYKFWSTTESEQLLNDLRLLRFGSRDQQEARKKSNVKRSDGLAPFLTAAERSTVSWQASFDAFMNRFYHWEGRSTEPSLVQFYQKCSILEGLIAIVPDPERKQALMRDLLTYLAMTEVRQMDPPVWRLQLDRAFAMPELSETERTALRELAKLSGDPYMRILSSRSRGR